MKPIVTFMLVFCVLLQCFVAVGGVSAYKCCFPSEPLEAATSCCQADGSEKDCTKKSNDSPMNDCSHDCSGSCCACHTLQKTFFFHKKEVVAQQKISLPTPTLSSTPYNAPHGISIAEVVWQPPRFLHYLV